MSPDHTTSTPPWHLVFATVAITLVAMALAGCSDSPAADADSTAPAPAGDDICALLTPSATAAVEEGMTSVLSGAELESSGAEGADCVQRFTSGDSWVELTYRDATGADDEGFSPLGETLLTDGARTSRAVLDDLTIDVVADTSDPAGISTWDASLVGAGALTSG